MNSNVHLQQVYELNQQFVSSNKNFKWDFIEQVLAILPKISEDVETSTMLVKPIYVYYFFNSEGECLFELTDDEEVAQQSGEEYEVASLEQLNENLGNGNDDVYQGILFTSDGLCEYIEDVVYFNGCTKITKCEYKPI